MQQNTAGLKLGSGFFEIDLNEIKMPNGPVAPVPMPIPVPEEIQNKQRALVKTPQESDRIAVLVMNADLLIKNDEKDLAQHLLRQSLYLNSYHAQSLSRLALCLTDPGKMDLKIKALEALKQSDYNFENLVHLANCYYQKNEDGKALATYQEALSILTEESPLLFEVYKNLGNISLREGDFESAEENYNKAHTQNGKSDALAVNQGTLAIQRADWEGAVGHFRQALQFNHRNDRAWVGLAMVHNAMGDFVLARGNVGKAVDLNPQNRTAVQLAATWALRDQDLGLAIEVLQNYLSTVDTDEEMSLLLIHLFCQRNQFSEALLEIERLLLWDPANLKLQKVEEEIRGMSVL